MRNSKESIFLFALIVFTTNLAIGCSSNSNAPSSTLNVPPVITPSSAILGAGQSLQFSAAAGGAPLASPVWVVDSVVGGSPLTGTITSSGLYTAPAGATPSSVTISVGANPNAAQSAAAQVSFFHPDHFTSGTVSSTANPLVALYNFSAPQGASMQVNFGTTTNYGLNTWSQPAPANGGNVGILVAGMRASTTYHMQAVVTLPDRTQVRDADQTFTTGALPADSLPNIAVQQTSGLTPGDGVELLDLFQDTPNNQLTALATDLEGNVIWYYPMQPTPPFPIKLLPNGHMLVATYTIVNEIDLAGNLIYALPLVQVASNVAAQGISFPPFNEFSHDIVKLSNGHYLLLIDFTRTDIPGNPSVAADAIIDWDPQQQKAVWTWNAFDHIPLSHAPNGLTDWTHANALVYSPDDGNLLLSMRNQNWIVKINYADGAGDGRILWHLGPQGDFALPAGMSQVEWNYGQHYPVFLSPSTAGVFSLLFFNNGNGRYEDSDNDECSTPGFPGCYSSVPVFQLDESTNTAQVLQEYNLAPVFSVCCGSAGQLSNGNIEYDIADDINHPKVSTVQEVTQLSNPQLVWQMSISGELAYRAFRILSLYPGVTWSQSALATANAAARAGNSSAIFAFTQSAKRRVRSSTGTPACAPSQPHCEDNRPATADPNQQAVSTYPMPSP